MLPTNGCKYAFEYQVYNSIASHTRYIIAPHHTTFKAEYQPLNRFTADAFVYPCGIYNIFMNFSVSVFFFL